MLYTLWLPLDHENLWKPWCLWESLKTSWKNLWKNLWKNNKKHDFWRQALNFKGDQIRLAMGKTGGYDARAPLEWLLVNLPKKERRQVMTAARSFNRISIARFDKCLTHVWQRDEKTWEALNLQSLQSFRLFGSAFISVAAARSFQHILEVSPWVIFQRKKDWGHSTECPQRRDRFSLVLPSSFFHVDHCLGTGQ